MKEEACNVFREWGRVVGELSEEMGLFIEEKNEKMKKIDEHIWLMMPDVSYLQVRTSLKCLNYLMMLKVCLCVAWRTHQI